MCTYSCSGDALDLGEDLMAHFAFPSRGEFEGAFLTHGWATAGRYIVSAQVHAYRMTARLMNKPAWPTPKLDQMLLVFTVKTGYRRCRK